MKKSYLILGGLVFTALALKSKYTNFVNKLTFKVKKAKVKLPFPYSNLNIILSCDIDNPTSTSVTLKQIFGKLKYQNKEIATIMGNGTTLKKGVNKIELVVNMSIQNLENVANLSFNISSFSSIYNQIIRTPFVSDVTYITSLGTFSSEDNWKLQDLI
jgi:hypothetical protein